MISKQGFEELAAAGGMAIFPASETMYGGDGGFVVVKPYFEDDARSRVGYDTSFYRVTLDGLAKFCFDWKGNEASDVSPHKKKFELTAVDR